MAVHLKAPLNTRFIPLLFSLALLLAVVGSSVHARAGEGPAPSADEPGLESGFEPTRDLRELAEKAGFPAPDESRIDRGPGFSVITYADGAAGNDEGLDRLPMQPPEAQLER